MNAPTTPLLLTPNMAAAVLGCTVTELRRWRAQGEGPAFHTLGPRTIRYNTFALHAYATTNR
jgi:hypothetical protein